MEKGRDQGKIKVKVVAGGEGKRGKKESKKGISRFVLYVDQIIIVCSCDTPTLLQHFFLFLSLF